MKKLLSLLLAAVMLLTMVACGGPAEEPTTVPATTPTTAPTTAPTTEPTTVPTTEPTTVPTEPAVEGTVYTFSETNPMGLEIVWTLTLNANGTYILSEVNDFVGEMSYEGTAYTLEGNTVVCGPMTSAPMISEWAKAEGFTATIDGESFAPVGIAAVSGVEPGTYTYTETNPMGLEIAWTLVLNEDGTYVLTEVNDFVGEVSYQGESWTAEGNTVNFGPMASAPAISDWAKAEGFSAAIDGETFNPGGETSEGPSDGGSAGPGEGQQTGENTNVAYASNSDAQVCDIYLPAEGENWPVIVLVHGGGFMFGDQGMDVILPVIDKALEKGYAVVSVDYRKSSEAVFPAAVADVKAAVRFVKAHAMDYGWDSKKIAVWGESAGAYLSLMTALTPGVAELNGDVTDYGIIDSEVTALVSFYAPVEFYTLYTEAGKPDSAAGSFESKFLGQDIMADKDATYKTYWETYADSIPADLMVWIQAGDADARVPHTQSVNFADRLKNYISEENIAHSIIEGADHEDDLFYTDENLDAVFNWLDGFMKG